MPRAVKVSSWHITVPLDGSARLGGEIASGPKAGQELVHSSPIVAFDERKGQVATKSGSIYTLVGPAQQGAYGAQMVQIQKLKAVLRRRGAASGSKERRGLFGRAR